MDCRNLIPGALVALGLLLGVFLASPPSHAGDTVILVPEDDRDVPEGSQIPDWRINETEEKVREYKKMMQEENSVLQQEGMPQYELPKPEVEQP